MSQEQASPDPILALPSFNDEDDGVGGGASTPWWRQRRTIIIFAILLLIVLLVAILLPILNRSQPVTYQYQKASRGSLSLTVSATGPIQSGIYNLVFSGSGGRIDSIYVKVGQSVKKGTKLAQLDKTTLQDALDQSQAAYLAAQSNYDSAQNTYNQTQGQLQSSINAAQTTLSNAMSALTKTQAQSQSSVNGALQTLTNDQVALTNTQQSSQDSISSAQTALSNDQQAVQTAQQQAQTSNAAAQRSVSNAQSSLNSARNQSNAQISLAYQQEQQALANCNAVSTGPGTPTAPTPTPQCTQIAQDTYNQTVATANNSVITAQNSLSAAQSQLASTQATSNANVTAAQARVNTDQKALTTAQSQSQTNNQSAQSKISSDQAALNTAQTTSSSSNTTAQNSVNSAQSGLKSAQSQAASTGASSQGQVVTAQGQVNTALESVTTAKHNLSNALLTAPHDGIVTTINGTVGGSPGTPQNSTSTGTATAGGTFIQIVDTSALQIQANINETDTANLKIGEVSTFTVNAYGNRAFRGTVASISPNGQTTSNVVTYPVSIDVDMSNTNLHDATLLPGMTANITVTVLNRDNVLTIPVDAVNYARLAGSSSTTTTGSRQAVVSRQEVTSALRQARQRLVELTNSNPQISNDNPLAAYVLERVNGQFVIKPVVLGLTDGTVYEVLDGLADNEVIVAGASTGGAGGAKG